MDLLTKSLLEDLLETPITVALYGGGFKPPTKGHFNVVEKTLEELPDIDQLILYVGGGERDGITQEESLKVWDIYKNYLSPKVTIEPSVAPIKSILNYAKNNPTHKVYWILGARDGDEGDLADIASRTRSIDKYPNLEVKIITSSGGVSGTKTRQAIKSNNKEQFLYMIPDVEEKEEIWNILKPAIKESKSRAQILKERQQKIQEGFFENMKTKFQKFLAALKQEGQETKEAVGLLVHAAQGKIELSDKEKEYIGNQLKDVLKTIGLLGIATLPGGFIAAALIKLFKAEHLVTPSAFVNEIGDASSKLYPFSGPNPSEILKLADEFFKKVTMSSVFGKSLIYNFSTDKANYAVKFQVDVERQTYVNFSGDPNFKSGPKYKTYVSVGFNIAGDEEEKDTNLNEQFSVLSTVTKIILDFIDQINKAGGNLVSLTVAPKSDAGKEAKLDSKRGRFYAAYIEKNLSKYPGYDTREGKDDLGNEYIEIYKKDTVNEVGEANLTPYKWKEIDREGYYVYTRFITNSETQYDVDIKSTVYFPPGQMEPQPALEIEFTAKLKDSEGSSAKIVVNKGEMYRVMSTIVDIIKKYIKKSKAQAIIYSPSKKSSEENFGTQRDNLYRAFISKAFPGTTFKQSGDFITAILPSVNEGTCGYDTDVATGKKLDTPGGLKEENIISETMTVYRLGEIPYDEESFFVTPDYKTWIKFYPGEEIHKITTNKLYLPLRSKSFSSWDELRSKYDSGEFTDDDVSYINPEESGIQDFEQYEIKPDDIIDLEQINLEEGRKKKPDPKKGTGKKPEGSGRRLYTDEDPKDTVRIKFKTKEDIVDTLNKTSFKAKSHARQSQVINLIHQRVRAAYGKAKDPEVKARLKRALDYIEKRKEMSKKKTERLRKLKEIVTSTEVICDNCGWEWKKADGGDDLYICHKCGHDNTPKKDDPFGLNELAKTFIKEVFHETWNPQEDFLSLCVFMKDNGMNISPLPKIKVIKDDEENASRLLGKTAYYNPADKSITLYTLGRHPKDVLRSFAHEMVHHEQNLNGTLGDITTTNTNEDDHLQELEKEAYLKGNIMFRNWEDSIKNV